MKNKIIKKNIVFTRYNTIFLKNVNQNAQTINIDIIAKISTGFTFKGTLKLLAFMRKDYYRDEIS